MSVGVMRCNKKGCNGFVVYEDADYDYKEAVRDGTYTVDDSLVCDTCGRKFKAILSHTFIYQENECEFEELESACITDYEKCRQDNK